MISIREWLSSSLFAFTNEAGDVLYDLTNGGVIGCVFAALVVFALFRLSLIGLSRYQQRHNVDVSLRKFTRRLLMFIAVIGWLILCMLSLRLDPAIWSGTEGPEGINFSYLNILIAILCILVARVADKLISARLIEEFETQTQKDIFNDQYGKNNQSNITGVVRNVLFILVGIFLLNNFGANEAFKINDQVSISLPQILWAILIILLARLALWIFTNLFLYGWYKREKIDLGKQYAYNQLLSYVVYFIAIIFALKYIKIDLTLLLAGAAALLVGIGIALQQVISDFFSGLVILSERSVEVGDFLDSGTYRGTVKKIGLRASVIETLEQKDIIVPNSHLVNESVTNWTSTRLHTRCDVSVGVAYGTDTALVKKLLLESADKTSGIMKKPMPFVRFANFGDSSLDFELYFYTQQVRVAEDIKSDARFEIDKTFRENDVSIPFPQRDIHIQGSGEK